MYLMSDHLLFGSADAFGFGTPLARLGAGPADVGTAGMRALARGLKDNRALRTLYLVKNQLGVKGAKVLANLLGTNFGLTHIYCAGSGVVSVRKLR